MNLYTHGTPSYFITRTTNPPNPVLYYFYSTYQPFYVDLTELTNQTKYFLVYSVGCLMAAFDEDSAILEPPPTPIPDTCVAEGFVEAYASKGAVAFWGNTRWEIMASSSIKHQAFLDFMLNNPLGLQTGIFLGLLKPTL